MQKHYKFLKSVSVLSLDAFHYKYITKVIEFTNYDCNSPSLFSPSNAQLSHYVDFHPCSYTDRTITAMYIPLIIIYQDVLRALLKTNTMKLSTTYNELFKEFRSAAPFHQLEEHPVDIVTLPFLSDSKGILAKKPRRGRGSKEFFPVTDAYIKENQEFTYHMFIPRGYTKSNRAIMLMHGLNEKNWKKYLPWALSLTLKTGCPVILFPMAFHMNRAPSMWSQPRIMQNLMQLRSGLSKQLSKSTFINAALSQRLDSFPHRFYLSGYQTANDMFKLISSIKNGLHPYFLADTRIDLFAYSIGAFLAQNMLIADDNQLLSDSKIILFCGGAVFKDMDGESKLIMDSSAFNKLVSYFVNNLENDIASSKPYTHLLKYSSLGRAFRSMIGPDLNWEVREEVFKANADRIKVIGLKRDTVIPSDKIIETMRGKNNDIPAKLEILDPPFEYSHEIPFPIGKNGNDELIDNSFEEIFSGSAEFFC